MRWSFKIARVAGIEVRVHATFFLLLAFFAFTYARQGGTPAAISGVIFVLLVFGCVLLHEFGHAIAARRYGIHTPDITLLPIGGVARLERMPDKPSQELVVAVAGPLVNVVIAAVLWIYLGMRNGLPDVETIRDVEPSLALKLLSVNLTLVIFNLIPAFPMDGGRILRSILAMRISYSRATQIAASIGQGCAVLFGFWGLMASHPLLILVAVFVYFGAANEAALADMKAASSGLRVEQAMVTQFRALSLTCTLDTAVEALLRTSQHEFPVVDEVGKVRGLLTRDDLIVALRKAGPDQPVAEVMRVDVPSVHQHMLFDRAFQVMQSSGCPALPVLNSDGKLVGLFTPENVGELVMVQSALRNAPSGTRPLIRIPPPLPR